MTSTDDTNSSIRRYSFIVMERLGRPLQDFLIRRKKGFTLNTVCQVGCRILQVFEQLHKIGKIYNDLKLDNILIGDSAGSPESLSSVKLIDFGLCSDYLDD